MKKAGHFRNCQLSVLGAGDLTHFSFLHLPVFQCEQSGNYFPGLSCVCKL